MGNTRRSLPSKLRGIIDLAQWPENFTFENMKYLAITLLGILGFASYGLSQDWNTDTLEWSVSEQLSNGAGYTLTYALQPAIFLNDTAYRPVIYYSCSDTSFIQTAGYIRQSGDSIFHRASSSSSEFLIYDFSIGAGTLISPVYCGPGFENELDVIGGTLITAGTDIISINGIERKHIYFEQSYDLTWISGLGTTQGLFQSQMCYADFYINLLCVHQNGVQIYPEGENTDCCPIFLDVQTRRDLSSFQIYPNPVFINQMLMIKGLPEPSEIGFFDLSGREILRTQLDQTESIDLSQLDLPAGVYVIRSSGYYAMRLIILEP